MGPDLIQDKGGGRDGGIRVLRLARTGNRFGPVVLPLVRPLTGPCPARQSAISVPHGSGGRAGLRPMSDGTSPPSHEGARRAFGVRSPGAGSPRDRMPWAVPPKVRLGPFSGRMENHYMSYQWFDFCSNSEVLQNNAQYARTKRGGCGISGGSAPPFAI